MTQPPPLPSSPSLRYQHQEICRLAMGHSCKRCLWSRPKHVLSLFSLRPHYPPSPSLPPPAPGVMPSGHGPLLHEVHESMKVPQKSSCPPLSPSPPLPLSPSPSLPLSLSPPPPLRRLSRHQHQEICRLAMGPLLHEVHESMKAAIARTATTSSDSSNSSSLMPLSSGGGLSPSSPPAAAPPASSPHPHIFLYSGHDATLMPLSGTFPPPLLSPLLLSPSCLFCLNRHITCFDPCISCTLVLHRPWSSSLWASNDNSTHYVRVLRNFEEVDMPRLTPPPGGSWADMPASAAAAAASGGGGGGAAADAADGAGSAGDGVVLCPWDQFVRILEWSEINKEHYERDCHVAKPRL
ncbi:unnamed protein product [Closterium sp. NIES-54]